MSTKAPPTQGAPSQPPGNPGHTGGKGEKSEYLYHTSENREAISSDSHYVGRCLIAHHHTSNDPQGG